MSSTLLGSIKDRYKFSGHEDFYILLFIRTFGNHNFLTPIRYCLCLGNMLVNARLVGTSCPVARGREQRRQKREKTAGERRRGHGGWPPVRHRHAGWFHGFSLLLSASFRQRRVTHGVSTAYLVGAHSRAFWGLPAKG